MKQVTPYGQIDYSISGEDPFGNPLWTQTQSLSPEQQAIFEQNQAINKTLGGVAQQGLGYVGSALEQPLGGEDFQRSVQDPELLNQQVTDALYRQNTQYLDPRFERQQAGLETQLANQGITRGSEAYNSAMSDLSQSREQTYASARDRAIAGGIGASQGMFGMGLQGAQFQNEASRQALAQAQLLRQDPINMLNAVRSGQQMQVAQLPQPLGFAQQGQTAGPDYMGAMDATYQGDLAGYNAQQAQQANMQSGLFGLGAAALMSDRRLKKNIKRIGKNIIGLPLYAFEYLWGEKAIGVMADEVEKVMPEAVIEHPSGYKMVNYALIGGNHAV